MKTAAGNELNHRNPTHAPARVAAEDRQVALSGDEGDRRVRQQHCAAMPAARPSRPSVRLTALAAPATTRKTITKNAAAPISNELVQTGIASVVGRPTTLTATVTSTAATPSERHHAPRPDRPSDRFLTIFMKSSSEPDRPARQRGEQHQHRLGGAAREDDEGQRRGHDDQQAAHGGGALLLGVPLGDEARAAARTGRPRWPAASAMNFGPQEHEQGRRRDGGDEDSRHLPPGRGQADPLEPPCSATP